MLSKTVGIALCDCRNSENTKLKRTGMTFCSPIEGKHLCLVSEVHVCDPLCLRKMFLKVRFPALYDLVYKYWIAAKC